MRFVLGSQFGLRSENWPEDFFAWFPDASYSADGQLIFRGPRFTMIVHSTPKHRTGMKQEEKASDHRGIPTLDALPPVSRQQSQRSVHSQPSIGNIMAVRQDRVSAIGCAPAVTLMKAQFSRTILLLCAGNCCVMHSARIRKHSGLFPLLVFATNRILLISVLGALSAIPEKQTLLI